MTDPLEINLPDPTGLDDGDLTVNVMTNAVHILQDGHWRLAGLGESTSVRLSLRRWDDIELAS